MASPVTQNRGMVILLTHYKSLHHVIHLLAMSEGNGSFHDKFRLL